MGALGTVLLGYAAQSDPDWAAAQMDALFAAHANRALGPQQAGAHTSVPASGVFQNPRTGRWTTVIYSPKPAAQTTTLYRGGKSVGTVPVPAGATVSVPLPEATP